MQTVQQEQARHQVVAGRAPSISARPGSPSLGDPLEEPRQGRAVEVEERLHQLPGLGAGGRIGESLEVLDQRLEALELAPDFGFVGRAHDDCSQAVVQRRSGLA